MAAGHQATAANMALALATVGWVTPGQAAALGVGALVTAAGPFSPDADNRRPLGLVLGHRKTLHGWGWPFLATVALVVAGAPLLAYGPVLGWWSHLFPADFVFGKGGQSIPKGIPVAPFGGKARMGLGLKVSGPYGGHSFLELAATVLLVAALAGQAWLLLG